MNNPKKRLLSNSTLLKVITLSFALHLLFGLFFGGKILLDHLRPDEVLLEAPPPVVGVEPQKRQYKVKIEKSQRNSSSPRPVPISVDIPSDVSIEKIDIKVTQSSRVRGRGQGDGNGLGNGYGGNGLGQSLQTDFIDFFGTRGGGDRVAFIVDYSVSMRRDGKLEKVQEELLRSLGQLQPGSKVAMVFFSGPYWIAGEDSAVVAQQWVKVTPETIKKGSVKNKDWGWSIRKGEKSEKLKWRRVSKSLINKLKDIVLETQTTGGTDWGPPFEAVLKMKPLPEQIFFITDGAPEPRIANEREVVDFVKKKARNRKIRINTISMGVPQSGAFLKEIAEFTDGEYRLLN